MQEWLAAHAADGFKAFAGTQIAASIHVSEALINEVLAKIVAGSTSESGSGGDGDVSDRLMAALLKHVTRAAVNVTEGVLIMDVELRV